MSPHTHHKLDVEGNHLGILMGFCCRCNAQGDFEACQYGYTPSTPNSSIIVQSSFFRLFHFTSAIGSVLFDFRLVIFTIFLVRSHNQNTRSSYLMLADSQRSTFDDFPSGIPFRFREPGGRGQDSRLAQAHHDSGPPGSHDHRCTERVDIW